MKLIIDISEEVYKKAKETHDTMCDSVWLGIKYGTPLPKGYGRIADIDAAIKCIEEAEGEDATWAISLIEWACSKRTIIEGDKESEEEK